jgi:hypothetical protein
MGKKRHNRTLRNSFARIRLGNNLPGVNYRKATPSSNRVKDGRSADE